jgi:hypothetical protein
MAGCLSQAGLACAHTASCKPALLTECRKHTQPRHKSMHTQPEPPLACCVFHTPAGTTIQLQAQVVNTGNTDLHGVQLSEPNVSSWVCKSGSSSTTDSTVSTSGTAFTAPGSIPHGHKLVCLGTYTFTQEELDIDQSSKVFTPAVATTTTPAVVVETTGFDTGYAVSTTVSISSVAALLVSVNAAACTVDSIIPPGEQSECCIETCVHSVPCLCRPACADYLPLSA